MGQIDQTLFDSNIANTVDAAQDLADALGELPSPATSDHTQATANAYASGRDIASKVQAFSQHKTPGSIDQTTFDAEMGVLLTAKDSLQAAEDELMDGYANYTAAANALIMDIEALTAFMTTPPAGAARKGKKGKVTEPDEGEDVLGVKKEHKRFMGFGKGKKK